MRKKIKYLIERNDNPLEFHIMRSEKGRMTKDLIAIFLQRKKLMNILKGLNEKVLH